MKRLALILLLLLDLGLGALRASEHRAIIIPVQFSDLEFSHSEAEFRALADSLKIYFDTQFHGSQSFSFDLGPVITLNKSYKYYGENSSAYNDALMYKGVADACKEADGSVNFANYTNGSDYVNDILILVPGKSEIDSGDTYLFWPQTLSLVEKDTYLYLDKKRIDHYAIASELDASGNFTGIGNLAHEYSHVLGLKDLYDTDGQDSGGLSKGLWGSTALMDKGNENAGGHLPPNYNAVDLYTLGIGLGTELTQTGDYTLEPIAGSGQYYIISTDTEGEVYLIECRKAEGYDALIGGSGILIYHVDKSENICGWSDYYKQNLAANLRWSYNQVNCNPAFECAALMTANPDASDVSEVFFPFGSHNSFGSGSNPALIYRSGGTCPFAITNISIDASGNASFSVIEPIIMGYSDVFQSSLILNWTVDEAITDVVKSEVICISGTDTLSTTEAGNVEGNAYSCTIDGLKPNTSYEFTIKVYTSSGAFYMIKTSEKTRPCRSNIYPFILLRPQGRNADGSYAKGSKIPLQVFNAPNATKFEWFFDGNPISTGADGYYALVKSGTLKVYIYHEDGSIEVIIKEISVR